MDLTAQTGAPEFYIPATSSLLERRPRTLKQGDTFAMFDHYGDFAGGIGNPEGLYHNDTRFLSVFRLQIENRKPLLLSSTVQNDNELLTVDVTNPDIYRQRELRLRRDSVHLYRCKFLWECACYEMITARNYDSEPRTATISLDFEADFQDIFEVRGHGRPRRGHLERHITGKNRVALRYTGLDRQVRETELVFEPVPDEILENRAEWQLTLQPGETRRLFITITCGPLAQPDHRFVTSLRRARRARLQSSRRVAAVRTSNALFNELLSRSISDLAMLNTDTAHGPYPYAGVPWFSTAFGRDGVITAIEMLAIDPGLARGVLHFLAATQARQTLPSRDAEPGKILHETRRGEMAILGEVPFDAYYGSIDSTPLFVLLAGLYWQRTGDIDTLRFLWPNIRAALDWIDRHGDCDGDGLVEYLRRSPDGLTNQGWKDSDDSVFHANGELARGSIALCEVQAYVYAAKSHAAEIAGALGEPAIAQRLTKEAEVLRAQFEEKYWMEDMGCYALALDGEKRPCRVRASNMGHALFCGIAAPDRALRVARELMTKELFSGWGVRTVGSAEARYNPMSYHNGSVWPHDNALIALGLARYAHVDEVLRILTAMFEASKHMELRRLPELFCGFPRRQGRGPTSYPVACNPQAWAGATPFAMLSAVLGLHLDAAGGRVRFVHPRLPDFLDEVEIGNLRLGSSHIDVLVHRRGGEVAVTVLSKKGPARVEVLL